MERQLPETRTYTNVYELLAGPGRPGPMGTEHTQERKA